MTTATSTATANSTTEHEEPTMTTTEVPLPLAAEATDTTGPRPAGWRRTLPAALRSERIKATTVRANTALLATSAIVGLLVNLYIIVFLVFLVVSSVRVAALQLDHGVGAALSTW